MINKLDYYISKKILKSILFVLTIMIFFDTTFSFINELNQRQNNYQTFDTIVFLFQNLPYKLYTLTPYACLLGCLISLGNLSVQNEIIIIQMSGCHRFKLLGLILKPISIIMIISLINGEYIVPKIKQQAEITKQNLRSMSSFGSDTGLWYHEKNMFIYIQQINLDNSVSKLHIFTFKNGQIITNMTAKKAIYKNNYWELQGVKTSDFSNKRFIYTEQKKKLWYSTLSPKLLRALFTNEDHLSISKLFKYGNYFTKNGMDGSNYLLHFWKKFLQPLLILSLIFLATSFVIGSFRGINLGFRIAYGSITGIIIVNLQHILEPACRVYHFHPIYTVLIPIFSCFILSLYFLKKYQS